MGASLPGLRSTLLNDRIFYQPQFPLYSHVARSCIEVCQACVTECEKHLMFEAKRTLGFSRTS
ncbi:MULTISPECIES: hypothetical protein [Leptolyngbya]|uniref:hypothetical protein n=1 Tax=Leptolyngbya TaxID=47251 RepID=UPI00168520F4|nr:hypothetical protein [Leptolyngbya sp. FACHB-1624]